jgi:hypothetical protein
MMDKTLFQEAELQVAYEFGNAPIRAFPYAHLYLEDVFPKSFYQAIQDNLPVGDQWSPIAEKRRVTGYHERFVCCFDEQSLGELDPQRQAFWRQFRDTFLRGSLKAFLLDKFRPQIERRFKGAMPAAFRDELLLVQDIQQYALGPHTDSPRKVVTVLFYLPPDLSQEALGTSIYLPRDAGFVCKGGPHYEREHFLRLKTMPFRPNSVFCFVKTDNSFHGVERIGDADCRRWLLLYDIYVDEQAAAPGPGVSPSSIIGRLGV